MFGIITVSICTELQNLHPPNMPPRSREELLASGVMNPDLAQEVKRNPIRKPQPSDPYYGRDDFFAQRDHRAATLSGKSHLRYLPDPIPDQVHEHDRMIPARDGVEIRVRIYTPLADPPPAGRPLYVAYHEGGWAMGGLVDEEVNCRLFSRDLACVCVNVEYRLAPEHKFPTWIDDSWDALQWAAANARAIGANPAAGFVIGGGSAGGNICAVLAHLARDAPLDPPLTGQYLCVPAITVIAPPDTIPARYRAEYLSHPSVTPPTDHSLPSLDAEGRTRHMHLIGADVDSPLMIPFLYGQQAPHGHRGLPPAYFQVCGTDVLRDEGLLYERILREEAAVPTRLDFYPGFGHYFWTNWPALQQSRDFVEDTVKGVGWLLEQGRKTQES